MKYLWDVKVTRLLTSWRKARLEIENLKARPEQAGVTELALTAAGFLVLGLLLGGAALLAWQTEACKAYRRNLWKEICEFLLCTSHNIFSKLRLKRNKYMRTVPSLPSIKLPPNIFLNLKLHRKVGWSSEMLKMLMGSTHLWQQIKIYCIKPSSTLLDYTVRPV